MGKTALIIGAGPAGLTAAYQLLAHTDITPIIFEATGEIGGISRTVRYQGNLLDIGPHRYFSKSQRVMRWWQDILPIAESQETDKTFLELRRLTRIYFSGKFFNYPISLNPRTLASLGLERLFKICATYAYTRCFPVSPEKTLEDFFINRFGGELYRMFFKDYTEKVWGIPCKQIPPEWGAQRVRGLSVTKVLYNALHKSKAQHTETSLIGQFLYPKLGSGQLWEEVISLIKARKGQIHLKHQVTGVNVKDNKVISLEVSDVNGQQSRIVEADYFFSSMPVKDLINGFHPAVPSGVLEVGQTLEYRDLIVVGMCFKPNGADFPRDNWIYVQDNKIKLSRVILFNNWSRALVKDKDTWWIGLEFPCQEGETFWTKPDTEIADMARNELEKLGLFDTAGVMDSIVVRVPKAYPAYWGGYANFRRVREFTDSFENLFLIGRNGMHHYNNMDHSMLSAMAAVDNIFQGIKDKRNIWQVNTESSYLEERPNECAKSSCA